jgi:hypothetical protein
MVRLLPESDFIQSNPAGGMADLPPGYHKEKSRIFLFGASD